MTAWRLYGWFCGLMLCGSCFGAIAWTSWMQLVVNVITGDDLSQTPENATLLIGLAYVLHCTLSITTAFAQYFYNRIGPIFL